MVYLRHFSGSTASRASSRWRTASNARPKIAKSTELAGKMQRCVCGVKAVDEREKRCVCVYACVGWGVLELRYEGATKLSPYFRQLTSHGSTAEPRSPGPTYPSPPASPAPRWARTLQPQRPLPVMSAAVQPGTSRPGRDRRPFHSPPP